MEVKRRVATGRNSQGHRRANCAIAFVEAPTRRELRASKDLIFNDKIVIEGDDGQRVALVSGGSHQLAHWRSTPIIGAKPVRRVTEYTKVELDEIDVCAMPRFVARSILEVVEDILEDLFHA